MATKTLNLKYFRVAILIFRVHMTSSECDHRLGEGTFLLVVNDDHASILHGYGDTGLVVHFELKQRLWR